MEISKSRDAGDPEDEEVLNFYNRMLNGIIQTHTATSSRNALVGLSEL